MNRTFKYIAIITLCLFTIKSTFSLQALELGLSTGIYGANVYENRLPFSNTLSDRPLLRSFFNLGLGLDIVFSRNISLNLESRLSVLGVEQFAGGFSVVKDSNNQTNIFRGSGSDTANMYDTIIDFSLIPEYRVYLNKTMFFSLGLGLQIFQTLGRKLLIGQATPFSQGVLLGPSFGLAASVGYHYRLTENILLQSKLNFYRHVFDTISRSDNIIRFSYGVSIGAAYSFDMR